MRMTVPALLAAVLFAGAAAPLRAVDVWMPQTGEVRLEETPRDSAEARRKHALALIGAGQWGGGVKEPRAMMDADPAADWVPQARLAIARGYLANDKPAAAFDELQPVVMAGPGSRQAEEARRLQFTAARVQTVRDVGKGKKLFEQLIETAPMWEDVVAAHRAKADALSEARYFLDVHDEYVAIVDIFPRSELAPYCWYKVAECEWELALWLGRSPEHMRAAEKQLGDFIDQYPGDPRVPMARAKVKEARRMRAAASWRTARFYIDTAGKPWAANAYLEQIVQEFEGLPEAEQATEELERMRDAGLVPDRPRVLQMPGAGWKEGSR